MQITVLEYKEERAGMEYESHGWMREEGAIVGTQGSTRYYLGQQEVSEDVYRAAIDVQRERDRVARREREFIMAEDAFAYAETLQDGVVLDWGRCYVALERNGLNFGFVIEPNDQPVITRDDLRAVPGPNSILARRGVRDGWLGGCSTNFLDPSQSYSDDEVEVIEDGTGMYARGTRLRVRVSPNMGARQSIGSDWRMKLFRAEDVQCVITSPIKEIKGDS